MDERQPNPALVAFLERNRPLLAYLKAKLNGRDPEMNRRVYAFFYRASRTLKALGLGDDDVRGWVASVRRLADALNGFDEAPDPTGAENLASIYRRAVDDGLAGREPASHWEGT